MADELGRQGDSGNALAPYREAIRLNPHIAGAHFQLAEQPRTSPDPALNVQVEVEFKAAIPLNRHDALSWRQLGGLMEAKGDFKASEENYKQSFCPSAEGFGTRNPSGDHVDFYESDWRGHCASGQKPILGRKFSLIRWQPDV